MDHLDEALFSLEDGLRHLLSGDVPDVSWVERLESLVEDMHAHLNDESYLSVESRVVVPKFPLETDD